MSHKFTKSVVWAIALLVSAGLLSVQFTLAQDAKAPVKKEEAQKDAAKPEAKQPKEPAGRLPNFYGDVVTKEQREQIYKIQKSYDDKIDALAAQLKALMAQRDTEIKGVLTAEQLKKVADLQLASKEKAQAALGKKAADAKPEGDKPGDAKPEAKVGESPKKPATKP